MKVFKFGGASLKTAAGVQQVARIILNSKLPLVVVVSAMGKTTDQLERLQLAFGNEEVFAQLLEQCKGYHYDIIRQLFTSPDTVMSAVNKQFDDIVSWLKEGGEFDAVYDQVVSKGEIISSIIVHHFLLEMGLPAQWLDARSGVSTDKTFREGKVDWENTGENIRKYFSADPPLTITQGFIGGTADGFTTTLGREGSDFTAAIFASILGAESVTIWKDVPGVMNADPKRLPAAIVFAELPFKEAAEMTYYGASVIHPKTIKPLANKGIPLLVKNFDNPDLPGTIIHECTVKELPPLIVFKDNQCLISCKVTDYTFINEQQLMTIFHALTELDIRINVLQNSAISLSFCIDFRENKVNALVQHLQETFEVYYNTGLTLITVKNYDADTFDTYRKKAGVILEQSSRSTLQVLVKPEDYR
jgi:aspartate kinase